MSKKPPSKLFNLWAPVVLWAIVIFLFSSHPTGQASQIYWEDFIVKKLAHMVEYGVLATLLYRATKSFSFSLLFCIFYGFTDEFHQSFTPGREPHLRDVIFDTIGASLALYILWKLLPKAPRKLLNWAKKLGVA